MKQISKKKLITRILGNQKASAGRRGHSQPAYTNKELYDWVIVQPKFNRLYDEWVKSNYEKDLAPSIDRINSKLSYTLDNIQLLTWKENRLKGYLETKLKYIKPVEQYTMKGEFVKDWYSMSKAAKDIGTSRQFIKRCADGIKHTTGGYQWKYKGSNKVIGDVTDIVAEFSHAANPVYKLDLEGNVLNQYSSLTEASKNIGYKGKRTSEIRACCEYKSKHFMNFKWRYVDENLNNKFKTEYENKLLLKVKPVVEKKPRIFKTVLQLTKEGTQIAEFESAVKAAEYINKPVKQLRKRLDGEKKSYCGFIWKYK